MTSPLRVFLRSLLALALAAGLSRMAQAQVQPYTLQPGDIVFSDTATGTVQAAVRVLRRDGTVDTLIQGWPLDYPSGVAIDRDGAVVVVNFQSQSSPANAVYRLPPDGGAPTRFNLPTAGPLNDCFMVARGALGELLVADGYSGVVEVRPDGSVEDFSPGHGNPFDSDIAFGLALKPDGTVLLSEAPRLGTDTAGAVYAIDAHGQRTELVRNRLFLRSPQDIALLPNGDWVVSHFDQYHPSDADPKLVRMVSNGQLQVLHDGSPLQKPKGIAADSFGALFVADTDAQALFRWDAQQGLTQLISDLDDGIDDGVPLNRPFDLAVVPELWLRVPQQPVAGELLEVWVQGIPRLGSHPLALFVSNQREAYALNQVWPGSPRSLSIHPQSADQLNLVLPAAGAPLRVARLLPPSMAGLALHLQALEPLKRLPSAALSFQVN